MPANYPISCMRNTKKFPFFKMKKFFENWTTGLSVTTAIFQWIKLIWIRLKMFFKGDSGK
jgi:hypothetical protein